MSKKSCNEYFNIAIEMGIVHVHSYLIAIEIKIIFRPLLLDFAGISYLIKIIIFGNLARGIAIAISFRMNCESHSQ